MPTIFIVESFGGKSQVNSFQMLQFHEKKMFVNFMNFCLILISIYSPISRHFVPNSKIGTNTALSDEYEYQFFPPIDSIFKYSIF